MQKIFGTCKRLCRNAMMMLQQKKPDDYVIATGEQYTVLEFINNVAKNLKWKFNGSEKD